MKPQKLEPPCKDGRVLLHVCCAPCSGGIIEQMIESMVQCTLYFYNPNIEPDHEYEKRKQAVIDFAMKKNIPFIIALNEGPLWKEAVKGHEQEPERGKRCEICIKLRLEKTALAAYQNNFLVFATTLGISRWKDMEMVNRIGRESASLYPYLTFWDYNWRKDDGSQRMVEVSKRENFYMQKYCGCVYSKRD